MTAVAGALGSLIGYLGAEVAEDVVFQRLLWPQRFHNHLDFWTCVKLMTLMPMGGPLHGAALTVLDKFRDKGIYRGAGRGHMLGTAMFKEQHIKYIHRNAVGDTSRHSPRDVRNGFWMEVLNNVRQDGPNWTSTKSPGEFSGESQQKLLRTKIKLFRLTLESLQVQAGAKQKNSSYVEVRENQITFHTVGGILASEISTIAFAVVIGVWQNVYWLSAYMCLPLVLRLLSLIASVHREELSEPSPLPATTPPGDSTQPLKASRRIEIYEIIHPDLGLALISCKSSSPATMLQFFRHYGHPLRQSPADRVREICCILLVYVFVIYFPAGLVSLLWMKPEVQYLWLGYQVYTIIAMHVARLGGFGECGSTEERIAKILETGRSVALSGSKAGASVLARLNVEEVDSVAEGRRRVAEIVAGNN